MLMLSLMIILRTKRLGFLIAPRLITMGHALGGFTLNSCYRERNQQIGH
jgi:hypothetical protein